MSDSLSLSATDHDLANEFTEIDNLIRRYIDTCQFKLAILWADKRLALCRKGGRPPSFFDMAKYVKVFFKLALRKNLIHFEILFIKM